MALIDKLRAIGNAIREKNGTSDLIPLADMPQAILDIVSGGSGTEYTSITYNADGAITLIDKDGITHTMVCTYENDRLISVTYDGQEIVIGYDSNDRLNKIGETVVGYEPFELSYADKLYAHFGIDKTTYPYVFITTQLNVTTYALYLNFGSEYSLGGSSITVTGVKKQLSSGNFTVDTTAEEIVDYIINKNPTLTNGKTYHSYAEDYKTFSNVDVSDKCTNFEMLITEAEAVRTTDYTNGFALGLASGGVVEVDNTNGGTSFGALDNTVTFIVEDELYESVSVKSGNSLYPPAVSPHREGYFFSHWSYNDDYMPNPFTPTEDTTITAVMYESLDAVYKMNGISREEYPEFIIFRYGTSSYTWCMYIAQEGDLSAREGSDGLKDGVYLTIPADAPYYSFVDNDYQGTEPEKAIEEFIPNTETTATQRTGELSHFIGEDSNCVFYTNTRLSLSRGEWYSFG